jgi:hypothetical protein
MDRDRSDELTNRMPIVPHEVAGVDCCWRPASKRVRLAQVVYVQMRAHHPRRCGARYENVGHRGYALPGARDPAHRVAAPGPGFPHKLCKNLWISRG